MVWGPGEGHGGKMCCGSGGRCGGELDGLVMVVEAEVGKWRMRMVVEKSFGTRGGLLVSGHWVCWMLVGF